MSIWWKKDVTINDCNNWNKNTLSELLDIRFIEIGDDFLKATMPVDKRTHQPYGLLHGGASVALAETIGSVGSSLIIDTDKFIGVGLDINANHIKSITSGHVIATATPLHIGGRTHVWDIKIKNEENKLICISRLTVAIIPKK